jgi:hypothetical protein
VENDLRRALDWIMLGMLPELAVPMRESGPPGRVDFVRRAVSLDQEEEETWSIDDWDRPD